MIKLLFLSESVMKPANTLSLKSPMHHKNVTPIPPKWKPVQNLKYFSFGGIRTHDCADAK